MNFLSVSDVSPAGEDAGNITLQYSFTPLSVLPPAAAGGNFRVSVVVNSGTAGEISSSVITMDPQLYT